MEHTACGTTRHDLSTIRIGARSKRIGRDPLGASSTRRVFRDGCGRDFGRGGFLLCFSGFGSFHLRGSCFVGMQQRGSE